MYVKVALILFHHSDSRYKENSTNCETYSYQNFSFAKTSLLLAAQQLHSSFFPSRKVIYFSFISNSGAAILCA